MQGRPISTRAVYAHHEPDRIKGETRLGFSTTSVRTIPSQALHLYQLLCTSSMTFEEVAIQKPTERAQCVGKALEEVLVSAKANECLTMGVYESAKVMNVDPDSVSFCVLAVDEEFECDIALQIHFTLIQAFCFDNDISIVRVNDMQRLTELIGDKSGQAEDPHCILITTPADGSWEDPALEKLHMFCEESRRSNDWLPEITLPGR